jgi:hypothetical protein
VSSGGCIICNKVHKYYFAVPTTSFICIECTQNKEKFTCLFESEYDGKCRGCGFDMSEKTHPSGKELFPAKKFCNGMTFCGIYMKNAEGFK